MAVKKTAAAAKETAVKAVEAAKEAVKTVETKAEAKVAEKKAEAKTAEKKAPAKKPAEKKAPAKKPAAKAEAKTEAKKENVVLQFAGKEINMDAIVESVKADFKANNKGCVRKLDVYVKPEDNAAYYVVNGKTEGKVDL